MQSNTSGGAVYDGLQITNNIVRVLNAQTCQSTGRYSAFGRTVTRIPATSPSAAISSLIRLLGNNPATNLQRGFRVTSHSSRDDDRLLTQAIQSTALTLASSGYAGSNFSGNQPIVVTGNTITNNTTGVLVQSQGLATLNFNRIVGNTTGLNNVDGSRHG